MTDIKYAKTLKRAIAFIIDQLLYLLLMVVLAFITAGIDVSAMVIFVVIIALDFVQLKMFKGRTIGKILLKLRIVDQNTLTAPDDLTIAKRMLLIRPVIELASAISSLLSLCYACISMSAAERSENRQSYWDKFAGTVVIDESGR